MEELVKDILKNENINASKIEKATTGFTNIVYFADEMVIKIAVDEDKKKKLSKEISIYQNINLNNIPKYISSGEINGYLYLIISKISGKSLYSIWHFLDDENRENCIKQIAETIKNFNNQNAEFLSNEYKIYDWEEYVLKELNENINKLNEREINTTKIIDFINNNELFKVNKYGLVYNDSHFDNFIYDNGNISLIDFDRVIYASLDYELLIFKTMCDNPSKFVSENDENNVFDEEFTKVYGWFRKYYDELFEFTDVEKRVKIYQFNYLIRQALNMKDKEFGNKWANELVSNF